MQCQCRCRRRIYGAGAAAVATSSPSAAELAELVATRARKVSLDSKRKTPFAIGAAQHSIAVERAWCVESQTQSARLIERFGQLCSIAQG